MDQRADAHGRADGIDPIVPDWFYRAVLDDALVLTIDREYFTLLEADHGLRCGPGRGTGQPERTVRTTIWCEVIARRQDGQPQLLPPFGTGAHQHRSVDRTGSQPAERPCAPDVGDIVLGEALGTDTNAARLARRLLEETVKR